MPSTNGNLTIQTASLWSSGDSNVFSGTGGPQGYDPFWAAFADVVSSTGLDAAPFDDQLWNVDAGDEVVFVIAVQNRGDTDAYDVTLHDVMPAGFEVEADDPVVNVMDGAGNLLDTSGDLFGPNGLTILDPVWAYDPDTGFNVLLVTFSVQATTAIQVPAATLANTATVLSYADYEGGPNLLSGALTASTTVATPTIGV